jgi:hypothetical protein
LRPLSLHCGAQRTAAALTRKIAAQEAELARPEGGREEAEAAETSRINFLNREIAVVQNELAELKAREDNDALDF